MDYPIVLAFSIIFKLTNINVVTVGNWKRPKCEKRMITRILALRCIFGMRNAMNALTCSLLNMVVKIIHF
jgi:hypothetical protein